MLNKLQVIVTLVVAIIISLSIDASNSIAWSGRIINSETGEPVEGAVIVRSWEREIATPVGSKSNFIGMTETLTDKDGEFTAMAQFHFPGILLLTKVIEQKPIIFKPGYKFLVVNEKGLEMKLEKIPTVINERKKEVDQARGNYEVDFYKTNVFKNMILEEEEFIESIGQEASKELQLALMEPTARQPETLRKKERITDKAEIEELIRTVSDSTSSLEDLRNAAYLLGQSEDPDAIEPLIRVLNSRLPGASIAADALSNYKEERVIRALTDNLKYDQELGGWVFTALRRLGPLAVGALMEKLKDSDPRVRRLATVLLADTKDERAVEPVLGMLCDKVSEVREGAAFALANFKDPRTVAPLISLWNDDERKVREQASRTLVSIGTVATQQLIRELINRNWYFRWRSAWCLGRIRDASTVENLLIAVDDKDERVRWTVIEALKRLRDKRAAKKLADLCYDHDTGIRKSVEAALMNILGKNICSQPIQP